MVCAQPQSCLRKATFTYFRGSAPAMGVITATRAKRRGQVAGGLITVTT